MNWGYKITIVILLFLAGMIYMVYVAMQQSNDTLDVRYYEREKKYQELIDAQNRLNAITDQRLISQNDSQIVVSIPTSACMGLQNGSISWLRYDDKQKDKELTLTLDSNCQQLSDKSAFEKGMYKVRIRWEYNNELYFNETDFFVTP
jgi:Tfp pilus assembly ATPase PilU